MFGVMIVLNQNILLSEIIGKRVNEFNSNGLGDVFEGLNLVKYLFLVKLLDMNLR
jgi:hypothetical protein